MGLSLALMGLALSTHAVNPSSPPDSDIYSSSSLPFIQPEIAHHIPHNKISVPTDDGQPEYINTNNHNRIRDILEKTKHKLETLVPLSPTTTYEDPEFLPHQPPPLSHRAVLPQIEDPGHMLDVTEYVPTQTALLEMQPIKFMHVPAAKGDVRTLDLSSTSSGASDLYLDATLTDDLDKDVKNAQTNERFMQRSTTTEMHIPASTSSFMSPEPVPDSLPPHLAGVFQQLAEKYERSFQTHFQDRLPHPSSYTESSEQPQSQHTFEYTHVVSIEPQILLPVPAVAFFQSDASQYQRAQMLYEALRAEAQRIGLRKTIEGNVALMEMGSKATPLAPLMTPNAPSVTSFIDPFPAMTPASLVAGFPQPSVGWTPASLSSWGASGFDGAGYGGMGGFVGNPMMNPNAMNPAMGNPQRIPSQDPNFPVMGVYSLGVRSPPPPLRPDNLPPPPYVPPSISSLSSGDASSTNSSF